jgi:ubiquinone/menaquinone biosynthesis C-methylase UbiE
VSTNSYFKYDNSQEELNKVLSDPDRRKTGETWFRNDTLDYWRHERMRAPLNPIVTHDTAASWLTVGDGRYGTDGHYLLSIGAQNVHCSDISDTLLRIGKEKGFINSFSVENAESLTFSDCAFDYVYCKEALHHFPRPYIALCEMFRVCKRAVILTEPRDPSIDKAPLSFLSSAKRAITRSNSNGHGFEPAGNYVYAISEREIDKFLLGMHYNTVAYIGCNDAFAPGIEFVPLNSSDVSHKKMKSKIFARIKFRDFFQKMGMVKSGILTAMLFRDKPDSNLIAEMQNSGWIFRDLPSNPYNVT